MKLPENLKFFSWMVKHGSLPTNFIRVNHHASADPSYQRFGADSETIIHTLRDCNRAATIWNYLGCANDQTFHMADPLSWFKSHALKDNGSMFVITCWFVWRARNEEVFSDTSKA